MWQRENRHYFTSFVHTTSPVVIIFLKKIHKDLYLLILKSVRSSFKVISCGTRVFIYATYARIFPLSWAFFVCGFTVDTIPIYIFRVPYPERCKEYHDIEVTMSVYIYYLLNEIASGFAEWYLSRFNFFFEGPLGSLFDVFTFCTYLSSVSYTRK